MSHHTLANRTDEHRNAKRRLQSDLQGRLLCTRVVLSKEEALRPVVSHARLGLVPQVRRGLRRVDTEGVLHSGPHQRLGDANSWVNVSAAGTHVLNCSCDHVWRSCIHNSRA